HSSRPTDFSSTLSSSVFLLVLLRPPTSTLFPYTTLFRSKALPKRSTRTRRIRIRRRCSPPFQFPTHGGCASVGPSGGSTKMFLRSEEHTSELQSPCNLVCRLLLEKKKKRISHKLAAPK